MTWNSTEHRNPLVSVNGRAIGNTCFVIFYSLDKPVLGRINTLLFTKCIQQKVADILTGV
jgi:hypothetical protein